MTHGARPRKTRENQGWIWDSTAWNGFPFRHDDIVVSTYAKTGTTWMQQIVLQLIFDGAEIENISGYSPWLDSRLPPLQEKLDRLSAQTHRRCIKTHLALDCLVYNPDIKYIYVARDGRDVAWSAHNHYHNMSDTLINAFLNASGNSRAPDPRPGPDVHEFYQTWIAGEYDIGGGKSPDFFDHVRGWWEARGTPNILLVHYSDLVADLPGQIRRIGAFLDIEPSDWDLVTSHCTFQYMKENAVRIVPFGEIGFAGGSKTFINKGTNQRWRDVLSEAEVKAYRQLAQDRLGPDCAAWLEAGWLGLEAKAVK